MEEEIKDPVGTEEAKENPTSGQPREENQDKVDYKSYRKVLSEKKARDARLQEMESRLKEFEQRDLERKGEYESLVNSLRQENQSLKSSIQERDRAYVMSKVNSAITSKALELGCKSPEKLLRLIEKDKIESLEVDDQFNVSQRDVEFLVNEAKKENDFLFKAARANVQDANPVDKPVVSEGKKVKDMTREEIEELYKQLSKR